MTHDESKDSVENNPLSCLSVGQIAKLCHVNRRTVHRWINDRKLKAFTLPSGHFRIHVGEFKNFAESYEIPIKDEHFLVPGTKIMVIDLSSSRIEEMCSILEGLDLSLHIEKSSQIIDACFKLSFLKPKLVFLISSSDEDLEKCLIQSLRGIEELLESKIIFVETDNESKMAGFVDKTMTWPIKKDDLFQIVNSYED